LLFFLAQARKAFPASSTSPLAALMAYSQMAIACFFGAAGTPMNAEFNE